MADLSGCKGFSKRLVTAAIDSCVHIVGLCRGNTWCPAYLGTSCLQPTLLQVFEAMRPWLVHGFCTTGPGHVARTFLCIHCHASLAEAHLNVWKPSKENATCLQSRRLPVLAEDMLPSECAREVVRPGTLHTALVYVYTRLAYPLFLEQLSACKLKACCADLHLWQLSAWAHRILLVSGVATRRTS